MQHPGFELAPLLGNFDVNSVVSLMQYLTFSGFVFSSLRLFCITVACSEALAQSALEDFFTWQGESNQALAEYGKSVGGAGDVNGDGFADVLVGCHYYSNPEFHEGKVFLYYGSPEGINPLEGWSFESNTENATLGISVSGAGDLNNDGFDDVIVGAHTFTGDQNSEGKVYVFYGSEDGLGDVPDWEMEGNQEGCDFGGIVSEAGDVNGDSYDDIIIGAIFYDGAEVDQGRAYVFYGSEGGLTSTPWTAEIAEPGITFGSHVSGAGDVNNDGFSEVIIGCRKYTNGENSEGGAFVFYGSPSGLEPDYTWHFESNLTGTKLGQSVSTAGDVNNDGFSDVIISGHNYSQPETDEGYALNFNGSASGLSFAPDFQLESNLTNALFGNQCANAGDVNGDGYDDVIIGSREYSNGETSEGRVYVFLGSSSGLLETDLWLAESNQESAFFGYSVSSAGDVNGDGADDVIIGAKYWDGGEEDEGGAFVFLGIPPSPCPSVSGVSIGSITSSSVTVSWADDADASSYNVIVKSKGELKNYFVTSNSVTIPGLTSSTNYKIIIRSQCGSQFSLRSFGGTFTTLP
ncbi:MAG: FG-GAP-like repeat-containing protein [Chitinophagales bacterium]